MPEPLRNIGTRLYSSTQSFYEEADGLYRSASGASAFWVVLDLSESSLFRIAYGDRPAYLRALAFSHAIREIADAYPGISIFKELGDAVLFRTGDFREVVELLVLFDLLSQYSEVDEKLNPSHPSMSVRSAITFGRCVEAGGDYFGPPLDRLSRVASVRTNSPTVLAVVDSQARAQLVDAIPQEYPFLRLDSSFLIPSDKIKAREPRFRIAEMHVDRAKAAEFRDMFARSRQAFGDA